MISSSIIGNENPPINQVVPQQLTPRLMAGETAQAFLTIKYIPGAVKERQIKETYSAFQLRSLLFVPAVKF